RSAAPAVTAVTARRAAAARTSDVFTLGLILQKEICRRVAALFSAGRSPPAAPPSKLIRSKSSMYLRLLFQIQFTPAPQPVACRTDRVGSANPAPKVVESMLSRL